MTMMLGNMKRKIDSLDTTEKPVKKKKVISATNSVTNKSSARKDFKNDDKGFKHKNAKNSEMVENRSKKNENVYKKSKKSLKHKENKISGKVENSTQKNEALDSTESQNKTKKKLTSKKFKKKKKKTQVPELTTFTQVKRITIPKEASSNWNVLSQVIIEDAKKKAEANSEENRHHKSKTGLKKKHEDPKKSGKNDESKEPDIWFDDVDEMLLDIEARKALRKRNGENVDENSVLKTGSFNGMTNAVALDCEMVGVGLYGRENMLARVSIVNENGQCLYDKYVKEMEEVVDYRTEFSGITPEHLKDGEEFFKVQKEVSEILKGRILVGHDLTHDLKVLFLQHDKKRIRDTSKYKVYRSLFGFRTPSLKKLVKEVLGLTIQEGEHDSVTDAMSAMRLYTLYKKQWEKELKEEKRKKQLKAFKSSKAGIQNKKEKLKT